MPAQIIRGQLASIDRYCKRLYPASDRVLWLAGDDRILGELLQLVEGIRSRIPKETFSRVVERHRTAASLLFPELESDLGQKRSRERESYLARPTSHMTHNWMLQFRLFEAWAALVVDLTDGLDFTFVVADAHRVDGVAAATIRTVFRNHAERAPNLVFGYDPQAQLVLDQDGILLRAHPYLLETMALDLQSLDGSETLDLPRPEPDGRPVTQALEPPHDRPGPSRGALDPTEALEAVRHGFRCFDFKSALRLGRRLLAADPALAPQDLSELHLMIALSAHNRQFATAGNVPLAEFIDDHLRQALAHESRPDRRCALLYRLAVTAGRRKKQFEEGMRWADRAVLESRDDRLEPLDAAYQETWGRNIRAYILMRQRRIDEAVDDVIAGFRRIDDALERFAATEGPAAADSMWLLDVQSTHSLLAHNTFGLSSFSNKPRRTMELWLERANAAIRAFPGVDRYEAAAWIHLYLQMHRLDLALPRLLTGLESARTALDARYQARYGTLAADICYRLGDCDQAAELLAGVEKLRRKCGLGTPLSVVMVQAFNAARQGQHEQACRALEASLQTATSTGDTDLRVQILLARGWLEALRGSGTTAERWTDEAIDLASESGERDTVLRVTVACGEIAGLLDCPEEAGEHYREALEILQIDADEAAKPPAGSVAIGLLGLLETDGLSPEVFEHCIQCFPEALDDPETWWRLPRFARLVALAVEQIPEVCDRQAAGIDHVLAASDQRPDCQSLTRALRSRLPARQDLVA